MTYHIKIGWLADGKPTIALTDVTVKRLTVQPIDGMIQGEDLRALYGGLRLKMQAVQFGCVKWIDMEAVHRTLATIYRIQKGVERKSNGRQSITPVIWVQGAGVEPLPFDEQFWDYWRLMQELS